MANGNGEAKFNRNSYLSIGLVGLLIASTIWIKDGQAKSYQVGLDVRNDLENYKKIQELQAQNVVSQISFISKQLDLQQAETAKDHGIFVERLRELNPNLHVPK